MLDIDATERLTNMVPNEWLKERVSAEEVEVDYLRVRRARAESAAATSNKDWEKMKALMQVGDELWAFCSPQDSWRNLAGRAGIALVRDGHVISSFNAMMN